MLHISSFQLCYILVRYHIKFSYFLKDYTGIYQNWKRLSSKQKAMVVEMVINKAKAEFKQSNIKSTKSLLESKDIDMDKLMAIIIEVITSVIGKQN